MPRRSYFTPVRGGSVLSGIGRGIEQGVANADAGMRGRRAEEFAIDERDYGRDRDALMDQRYEEEFTRRQGREAVADRRFEEGLDRDLRSEGWRPGAVPRVAGQSTFDGMDFMVPDPEYETMAGPAGGYTRMRPEARYTNIAEQLIAGDPERFAGVDAGGLGEGLMAGVSAEEFLPWNRRGPEMSARARAGERSAEAGAQRQAAIDLLVQRVEADTESTNRDAALTAALEMLKSELEVDRTERIYGDLRSRQGGTAAPPGPPVPPGSEATGPEDDVIGPYMEQFNRFGGDEARFTQFLTDVGLNAEDIAFILEQVRTSAAPGS